MVPVIVTSMKVILLLRSYPLSKAQYSPASRDLQAVTIRPLVPSQLQNASRHQLDLAKPRPTLE